MDAGGVAHEIASLRPGLHHQVSTQHPVRAPARAANRLASYCPTVIGGKSVLCLKSQLHLNQDGVRTGDGTATLPVADLFRQIIDEVQPKLVITTGTAGATYAEHDLGDVMITRAAKFRCQQEFRNEPFANALYRCDFDLSLDRFEDAKKLLAAHASHLTEPDSRHPPPSTIWATGTSCPAGRTAPR